MKQPKKLPKQKVLKKLHKRLWSIFSEYVRRKSKGECYTCRVKKDWRELDASHFLHGRLDYSEINVRACCRKCNRFIHGNLGNYAERLLREHGSSILDDLRREAAQIKKWTPEEFEELIEKYTKLNQELC